MGMGMLIFTLFGIVEGVTGFRLMRTGALVGIGYCAWAIGRFFDSRKLLNYFIALLAYFLGMITFSVVALGVGLSIDLIFKQ
jgi:hypothetical protein